MVSNNVLSISRQLVTKNLSRATTRLRLANENALRPQYCSSPIERSIYTIACGTERLSLGNRASGLCINREPTASLNGSVLVSHQSINLVSKRSKKTRGRDYKKEADDKDDEEDDDDGEEENPLLMDEFSDNPADGGQKIVIDVGSFRLDAVGKVGFVVTRQKMEELFYKGDLYINGERASKKSQDLHVGDEIDLVKNINAEDRNKVDIKRIQIVEVPDKASEHGRMKITIYRWSDLTIDHPDRKEE